MSPHDGQQKVRRFKLLIYILVSCWICLHLQLFWTHQDIFQFDVSVHQTLTVQEADPLHHVQGDLKSLSQRQTGLAERHETKPELILVFVLNSKLSCFM